MMNFAVSQLENVNNGNDSRYLRWLIVTMSIWLWLFSMQERHICNFVYAINRKGAKPLSEAIITDAYIRLSASLI